MYDYKRVLDRIIEQAFYLKEQDLPEDPEYKGVIEGMVGVASSCLADVIRKYKRTPSSVKDQLDW